MTAPPTSGSGCAPLSVEKSPVSVLKAFVSNNVSMPMPKRVRHAETDVHVRREMLRVVDAHVLRVGDELEIARRVERIEREVALVQRAAVDLRVEDQRAARCR